MVHLFYDLHIHSCLSPCGDDDMTPGDICAMASLKGLDMIALTDHNTGLNLSAALEAAADNGLLMIPGMEITTREEVHVLGYFPGVAAAVEIGEVIRKHLPKTKNNASFFGRQLVMNASGNIIGEEDALLIGATDMSLTETVDLIRSFEGVPVPAHINLGSNGILSNLGFIPDEIGFTAIEVSPRFPCPKSVLQNRRVLHSSDAHYLGDISEAEEQITLAEKSIDAFLAWLRGN